MDITTLRKELGLSLEAFGAAIGLKSRGQVSDLEAGRRTPSVPVALALEKLSAGRMDAATLNVDVAMVRSAANDTVPQSEAA